MASADRLPEVFHYIDTHGARWSLAEADMTLASEERLNIRAGGGLVTAHPAGPPFLDYEVIIDGEPPRFWTKYADHDQGLVYEHVPKLLITHLITRRGGIDDLLLQTQEVPRPITTLEEVRLLLAQVLGRPVAPEVFSVR